MAVQTSSALQHLTQTVHQWEQRRRWQQVNLWMPRAVMVALGLAVMAAAASRLTPLLSDSQVLWLTGGLVALAALTVLGGVLLRPRSTLKAAQRFDLRFGLRERVSTALELIGGTIHSDPALSAHQIDDAVGVVASVDVRQRIPFVVDWRAWSIVASLAVALILLLVLVPPAQAQTAEEVRQQAVIEDAAESVRDAMQDIAADNTLGEDERRQLLEALQSNLNTLRDEDITAEEAFATLKETESLLAEQGEQSTLSAEELQAALAAAAQAMNQVQPENEGEQPSAESAAAAAAALAQMLEQMTPEERQALEEALAQAQQQMMQAGEQAAAQELQNAQQALQQGDLAQAQQALENAAQQMQNAQQQAGDQQQSGENLQQQAQNFSQLQEQLGEQPQPQQQNNSDQSGSEGEGSESGEQPGQGSGTGQGQSGDGTDNTMSGESGTTNNADDGGQTQTGAGAAGAGDGQGDLGEDVSAGGAGGSDASDTAEANNNPDGLGVGEYEAIFAPQTQNGSGDDELRLSTDPSEVPAAEGEFAANPTGRSTVPYNEVFSDYANAANRALESDYIPLGMRDLIRQYFSSLEPTR